VGYGAVKVCEARYLWFLPVTQSPNRHDGEEHSHKDREEELHHANDLGHAVVLARARNDGDVECGSDSEREDDGEEEQLAVKYEVLF
jgi:hypothetical protein